MYSAPRKHLRASKGRVFKAQLTRIASDPNVSLS